MKNASLILISIVVMVAVFSQPPIMQDPLYHEFADQRGFLFLPNALDVLSNLPFILVGAMGLMRLHSSPSIVLAKEVGYLYRVFFAAVVLTGAGSFYYHLTPDNAGLVWDRLPMAMTFMAFFSIVLAEHISVRIAVILFPVLLSGGLASVLYWIWSESLGQGDLRLYLLVQFLPILLIPLIMMVFPARYSERRYYGLIIGCYVLAKLLEHLDREIFEILGLVSGHTLKHLVSALAVLLFLRMLSHRSVLAVDP